MSSAKLTNPPAKILLNQSTSISLNDRFSQFAKVRRTQPVSSAGAAAAAVTSPNNSLRTRFNNNKFATNNNLFQRSASNKNRRLALQMANRPSVQAALKIKKKSIKQRLGLNNINNNNKNGGQQQQQLGKGPLRQRIGRGGSGSGGAIRRRPNIFSRLTGVSRGNGIVKRGGRGGFGVRRNNLNARLGNAMNKSINSNSGNNSFNSKRNAIVAATGGLTRGYRRGGFRRGGGGGRGGNRRGGKQQQVQQKPKSKESLDTDLDSYMSKSKSHLDQQLDTYMASTTN